MVSSGIGPPREEKASQFAYVCSLIQAASPPSSWQSPWEFMGGRESRPRPFPSLSSALPGWERLQGERQLFHEPNKALPGLVWAPQRAAEASSAVLAQPPGGFSRTAWRDVPRLGFRA